MIPVILSGGSGTRLWPLSRPLYPKQFLALHSDLTLFQETLKRLDSIHLQAPIIVANDEHRFIVAENLRAINMTVQRIILEPVGRNTAPAIAIAALAAVELEEDPILFVLPADHVIQDQVAFQAAAIKAKALAAKGHLVTFGIKPITPHTGYGYIEAGNDVESGAYTIKAFKEKPDQPTAEKFFNDKGYFWNSGMFVFRAQQYLAELEKHEPDMLHHAKKALADGSKDLDFYRLEKESFSQCKNISIDYAVMERTQDGVVVMLDARWCDVGSWNSLWDVLEKDKDGNVTHGDVLLESSENNYVYAEHKLVSTLGVQDLVIIDTKDALLIANRFEVENLKDIVNRLNKEGRKEAQQHRTVYRPWGHYDSVSGGDSDQVKRITVHPGKQLSLQKHEKRAEHWVVVQGEATVIRGEETVIVQQNQSIYIPFGVPHALKNAGSTPLEIIEIQTGGYFGEDDIIRLNSR